MISNTVMAIDASHWASLLEPREVARVLKVSPKTVNKLVREGKLPCVQVTAREGGFAEKLMGHR